MTRPVMLGSRAALAATGALCFATTMAAPVGAADSQTRAAPPAAPGTTTVTMSVKDRSLVYGQKADVHGRVAGALAGNVVTLQLARPDGTWQSLAQGLTAGGGRYHLRARLPASAVVRVVAHGAQARLAGTGASEPPVSAHARIAVAPDVVAHRRHLDVLAGHRALLRGAIRPALGGHRVLLQRRTRGGWATIARGRTRAAGRFALRTVAWRPLSAPVRVAVAGGDGFAPRREAMGRLNVFRRALASWYGPGFWGQHLGCGGILRPGRLGVAHKTLPCGTMLTLRHGGWTVRAAVIDRGPYVGGREFDLTAATKDRLHFGGVGTVLVTR